MIITEFTIKNYKEPNRTSRHLGAENQSRQNLSKMCG